MKCRILLSVLFVSSLAFTCAHADDTADFIALYNKRDLKNAQAKVKGFADPRLMKADLTPVTLVADANLKKTVSSAPLLNLKGNADSKQAKDSALIALSEIQRITKDLALEIQLASFNTAKASDPIPGFLVFITKGGAIVQITSLGELAEEVDRKTEQFESEKEIKGLLTLLAKSIQQPPERDN